MRLYSRIVISFVRPTIVTDLNADTLNCVDYIIMYRRAQLGDQRARLLVDIVIFKSGAADLGSGKNKLRLNVIGPPSDKDESSLM